MRITGHPRDSSNASMAAMAPVSLPVVESMDMSERAISDTPSGMTGRIGGQTPIITKTGSDPDY
jgi:hypothetical protein